MKKLLHRFDSLSDAKRVIGSLVVAFMLFMPFLFDFIKFQTKLGQRISIWIEKQERVDRAEQE